MSETCKGACLRNYISDCSDSCRTVPNPYADFVAVSVKYGSNLNLFCFTVPHYCQCKRFSVAFTEQLGHLDYTVYFLAFNCRDGIADSYSGVISRIYSAVSAVYVGHSDNQNAFGSQFNSKAHSSGIYFYIAVNSDVNIFKRYYSEKPGFTAVIFSE